MVWLGYAGLSGAIVFSMALLAWIVGLRGEAVLQLVTYAGASLLALGLIVHLCAITLRPRPKRPPPSVALLRQPTVQAAATRPEVATARLAQPPSQDPGAIGALWPKQAARLSRGQPARHADKRNALITSA